MAHQDDLNTSLIAVVGFISALLTFLCIILIQVWYYNYREGEIERKLISQPFAEYESLKADQDEILNSYTIDSEKQVYKLPIDVAMDVVVRETVSSSSN